MNKAIRWMVTQKPYYFESWVRGILKAYETHMGRLGNQLGTTVNTYNTAYKEFKKVDRDVMKITGKTVDVDPMVLDKPDLEE